MQSTQAVLGQVYFDLDVGVGVGVGVGVEVMVGVTRETELLTRER